MSIYLVVGNQVLHTAARTAASTVNSVGFKEFLLSSKKCYSILDLGSISQILNSIYFYQFTTLGHLANE